MSTAPRVAAYVETLETSAREWAGAPRVTQSAMPPVVAIKGGRMSALQFAAVAFAVFAGAAAIALALI